jgi:hypothetical protein
VLDLVDSVVDQILRMVSHSLSGRGGVEAVREPRAVQRR